MKDWYSDPDYTEFRAQQFTDMLAKDGIITPATQEEYERVTGEFPALAPDPIVWERRTPQGMVQYYAQGHPGMRWLIELWGADAHLPPADATADELRAHGYTLCADPAICAWFLALLEKEGASK